MNQYEKYEVLFSTPSLNIFIPWGLLFSFEVQRINIMNFIFYFQGSFDASLIWLRPDIPKWYIGRNCTLGVSPNSTRKGSARNFRRKPVFMRFPAFITSQHVQIVQITSSWTLGCFTQIEIKQLICTIVEWVRFSDSDFFFFKKASQSKGTLDTKILGLTVWTLASFPALAPDAWFQAIPLPQSVSQCLYMPFIHCSFLTKIFNNFFL